ncbi:transcriptional regulator, TetR family [Lachnospiraceae bacterium NK3A20]|nr:transcriptional regulator, TetR family [Lachnospiraceae bacterium NK3A20]
MRMTGKAAENKRQKREALLNTAFDLFTQQGITNTSIANIVERAGVAKGTFYLYFKDKYDLRDRLIRHKASQILGRAYNALETAQLSTLEEKVIFLAVNIVDQLSEDKLTLRFITKNLSWGILKHEMSTIQTNVFEGEINFIDHFRAAFDESDVKYKNPEVLMYMIVELVGSASYSSILNGDPLPIEELRPYLREAIKAIMRSQEVKPQTDTQAPLPDAAPQRLREA